MFLHIPKDYFKIFLKAYAVCISLMTCQDLFNSKEHKPDVVGIKFIWSELMHVLQFNATFVNNQLKLNINTSVLLTCILWPMALL